MKMDELTTRAMEKCDYDTIVRVIDKWWGGPTSALAHPIFFYQLGEFARVVESNGEVVGFLLGFITPDGKTGYVHLVGIHPDFRRHGVGSRLYLSFEKACRNAGCAELQAITTLGNHGSVRFHQALNWQVTETENYAGQGRTRIIFSKNLSG